MYEPTTMECMYCQSVLSTAAGCRNIKFPLSLSLSPQASRWCSTDADADADAGSHHGYASTGKPSSNGTCLPDRQQADEGCGISAMLWQVVL